MQFLLGLYSVQHFSPTQCSVSPQRLLWPLFPSQSPVVFLFSFYLGPSQNHVSYSQQFFVWLWPKQFVKICVRVFENVTLYLIHLSLHFLKFKFIGGDGGGSLQDDAISSVYRWGAPGLCCTGGTHPIIMRMLCVIKCSLKLIYFCWPLPRVINQNNYRRRCVFLFSLPSILYFVCVHTTFNNPLFPKNETNLRKKESFTPTKVS